MLLHHIRQKLSRSSQVDSSSRARNSVSVPNNQTTQNDTSQQTTDKSLIATKNNQSESINIENLLAMKRTLSPVRASENPYSEDFLKEDNPLKKRVKQYFKKHEIVSLQHKLMVLAPRTAALNSANVTQPKADPLNLKPFLLNPYEKNFTFDKQFSPVNTRRESIKVMAVASRTRKQSSENHHHHILSTEEDKSPRQNFKPTETSKWDKFLRNRGSVASQAKNVDPKVASIRASSYGDVDAETVGTFSHVDDSIQNLPDVFENPRYWLDYPTRKNSRPDSGETNLNFRVTKISRPRYLDTSEEDILSKEGSLMKYFRTKNNKTRPTSTKRPRELRPQTQGNVQANQTLQPIIPKAEDQNRAQSARIDPNLKSRRTTTAQARRRVDISMEQSSINASTIANNTPAQKVDNSVISSVDLFTKKVKKHIGEARASNSTKENTVLFSSMLIKGSMESKKSLPLREATPYNEEAVEELTEDKLDEIIDRALQQKPQNKREPEEDMNIQNQEILKSLEMDSVVETLSDLTKDNERIEEEPEEALFVKESPFSKEMGNLIFHSRQQRAKLAVDSLVSDFVNEADLKKKNDDEAADAFEQADKVWDQGGLTQHKIRPSATFGNAIFMNEGKEGVNEIQNKVGVINSSLKATIESKEKLYKTLHNNIDKVQLLVSSKLTNNEMNILRESYAKERRTDADAEKMDVFLERLKFFAQLTKEVRLRFFKNATYLKQEKGRYVFHQGDEGDLMYVILRGSVNVKIQRKFKNGQSQFISVNSLYDGHHFGELAITELNIDFNKTRDGKFDTTTTQGDESPEAGSAANSPANKNTTRRFMKIDDLITDHHSKKMSKVQRVLDKKNKANSLAPPKRAASIQCAEDTEFLAIDRNKYREILASVMNHELDTKIQVLQLIPFFQECDNFELMPLATNLKTQTFKLGQRIINCGDIVMNYYVVSKGRCKVVKEIVEQAENVEAMRQTMRSFKFKDFGENGESDTSLIVKDSMVRAQQRARGCSNPMRRTFHQEPLLEEKTTPSSKRYSSTPKYRKFATHVTCKEFARGDHFGFKPLLGTEKELVYATNQQNHAQLSVIADTPEVELYVLPRASLMFIPERIKNILVDGVATSTDFDDCDIQEKIQEYKTWQKYKDNLVKDAREK